MRKFIFISTGIIFLLAATALIIIGTGEKDSLMLILFSASVPFIFTGYWNLFTLKFENNLSSGNEYFTYHSAGKFGAGAFYNRAVAVPVFLCMFTSVALAILTAFTAVNRSAEDIAYAFPAVSFSVCLFITIYFSGKINKALHLAAENTDPQDVNDDAGIKIAFFFASIATLGLFPLGYFIYKGFKKNSSNNRT